MIIIWNGRAEGLTWYEHIFGPVKAKVWWGRRFSPRYGDGAVMLASGGSCGFLQFGHVVFVMVFVLQLAKPGLFKRLPKSPIYAKITVQMAEARRISWAMQCISSLQVRWASKHDVRCSVQRLHHEEKSPNQYGLPNGVGYNGIGRMEGGRQRFRWRWAKRNGGRIWLWHWHWSWVWMEWSEADSIGICVSVVELNGGRQMGRTAYLTVWWGGSHVVFQQVETERYTEMRWDK